LRQVDGFLWVLSTNKTDRNDITEILLKVTLNTITITTQLGYGVIWLRYLFAPDHFGVIWLRYLFAPDHFGVIWLRYLFAPDHFAPL
jgi:hypothetical protein